MPDLLALPVLTGLPLRPAFHMGPLHAYEQALVLVLAFGPFVLLGAVVWWRSRQDRAEAEAGPSGAAEVGQADPVLDLQRLEDEVVDEPLQTAPEEGDPHRDVERDGLGRRPS